MHLPHSSSPVAQLRDHPQRAALHNEIHARPPEAAKAPTAFLHIVMLADAAGREASRAPVISSQSHALGGNENTVLPQRDKLGLPARFGHGSTRRFHRGQISVSHERARIGLQCQQSVPGISRDRGRRVQDLSDII